MPSSCLAVPVADQPLTENLTENLGGDLAVMRAGCGALTEYLNRVVDHRLWRGLRYGLGFLLAVVVAATACAGHGEVAAVAQWAVEAPRWVLAALGATPDPLTGLITAPSKSTLRRALARVDAAELQRLSAEWIGLLRTGQGRVPGVRLPAVAIDAKSVRGAASGGCPRPHVLGATTHDGATVLAQRPVADKGSEISELPALMAELDLAGTVVTVDALCRRRYKASYGDVLVMPTCCLCARVTARSGCSRSA